MITKNSTRIQVLIDQKLKKKAETNLLAKGINLNDAVKMFIVGIANQDINIGIFHQETLSLEEEKELIKIKKEFDQDKKNGKVLKANTVSDLKKQLEND